MTYQDTCIREEWFRTARAGIWVLEHLGLSFSSEELPTLVPTPSRIASVSISQLCKSREPRPTSQGHPEDLQGLPYSMLKVTAAHALPHSESSHPLLLSKWSSCIQLQQITAGFSFELLLWACRGTSFQRAGRQEWLEGLTSTLAQLVATTDSPKPSFYLPNATKSSHSISTRPL